MEIAVLLLTRLTKRNLPAIGGNGVEANYNLSFEDTECSDLNRVNLVGRITRDFERSHEQSHSSFVKTMVEVPRTSGTTDLIPVILDVEKVLDIVDKKQSPVGKYVEIQGRMCSFADFPNHETHITRYVFANRFRMYDNEDELKSPVGTNRLVLRGTMKYYPSFKVTPSGRQIAEFVLISKRRNGCADRIPCVAWGINAIDLSGYDKNSNVEVCGRIQSRDYNKTLDNGETVKRTSYELSVFDYREVAEKSSENTKNVFSGIGKLVTAY